MAFENWLIDHAVEIASLIVAIIGFWVAGKYLIKINNKQYINLVNSPNSPIIQAGGNVTSSSIETFKKQRKKEIAFSEESIEVEKNPKKQIKKIEDYLDENKPISLITEMSLRLAKELEMKEDEAWLEKEVYGFRDNLGEDYKKSGLKMIKPEEKFQYRRVEAELNIMLKNGHLETFDVPIFFSQSIRQMEEWVERYSKEQQIIMNAPPMELMVKILNVDPNKSVPYLVNPSSLSRVLNNVRLKVIEFLGRAKAIASI